MQDITTFTNIISAVIKHCDILTPIITEKPERLGININIFLKINWKI